MNQIVIAVLSSGALFTFIQFLFKRHDEKKEKNDDVKDALMVILQDKLTYLTEKAIGNGRITHRQLEAITEMHEKYKKLGGNGYLDGNLEKCKGLKRVQ